jgi:hypothetical protein
MKGGLLISGSGSLIYLTSHANFIDSGLIEKFKAKGITKFIAYEIPVDEARKRYAEHFEIVIRDLKENDDLRILDYDGTRAFRMFSFREMGQPYLHE